MAKEKTKSKPYRNKHPNNNAREIDEANEEEIIKSEPNGYMEHLANEALMLFSDAKYRGKKYRLFYGVGKVYRIARGEKQDYVYINFGIFHTKKPRLVVVYDNQARRQIMTLKRGQVCQVYGLCRYIMSEVEFNNGQKKFWRRLGLYASAIQGWYVPTMLDIKKMPTNNDIVPQSEKEEDLGETFSSVLDEFMNGNEGEEEYGKII